MCPAADPSDMSLTSKPNTLLPGFGIPKTSAMVDVPPPLMVAMTFGPAALAGPTMAPMRKAATANELRRRFIGGSSSRPHCVPLAADVGRPSPPEPMEYGRDEGSRP